VYYCRAGIHFQGSHYCRWPRTYCLLGSQLFLHASRAARGSVLDSRRLILLSTEVVGGLRGTTSCKQEIVRNREAPNSKYNEPSQPASKPHHVSFHPSWRREKAGMGDSRLARLWPHNRGEVAPSAYQIAST
jgi:hypothetical protein